MGGGGLHLFVDHRGAAVERAAEEEREAEDIVDLVGIIRSSRANHGVRPRFSRQFRHDFGSRIGKRQDKRIGRHVLHHFGLQRPGLGQPNIDIGAGHNFAELGLVGVLSKGAAPAIDRVMPHLGD